MLDGATFSRERMAAAASDELIAATDIADLLVRRGVPFRECHGDRRRPRPRRRSTPGAPQRLRAGGAARRTPSTSTARSPSVLDAALVAGVQGRRRAAPRCRASASSSPPPARAAALRRAGTLTGRLLRPAGARGRPGPRRLRGAPRRHRRRDRRDRGLPPLRGRLPRLRRPDAAHVDALRARRASPTSTAPTASTRCSTRSASRRASAPRCSSARSSRSTASRSCARGAGVARDVDLCSGPGKLTQALGHRPRAQRARRWSTARSAIEPRAAGVGGAARSSTGPRIGITKAVDLPWRFCAAGSRHVSRPWPPGLRAPRAAARLSYGVGLTPPRRPAARPAPAVGGRRRGGGRGRRGRRRRRGAGSAAWPGVVGLADGACPPVVDVPSPPVDGACFGSSSSGSAGAVAPARPVSARASWSSSVSGGRPLRLRSRVGVAVERPCSPPSMKSCQISAGNVPPVDRLALELGLHRLELVGVADPHGDRQAVGEAHEPGVAGVLGRARSCRRRRTRSPPACPCPARRRCS